MPEGPDRKMTVLNRYRDPRGGPVPELRLAGKWLGQAGFAPGTRVSIAVEQGRLVVTVAAPARPRDEDVALVERLVAEDAALVEELMAEVRRLREQALPRRRRKYDGE
jgi:hypothetical protein